MNEQKKPLFDNSSYLSSRPTNTDLIRSSSVISWRAIFAGVAIAIFAYMLFMSLGLAIGGGNLQGAIEGSDSLSGIGIGSAIWIILSVIVSLFVGSYAASRVGGMMPIRVGRSQGIVIASLFFLLMLGQLGSMVMGLGRGAGNILGSVAGGTSSLAQDPTVQDTVSRAMGDLNLKSPPTEVAQGITIRVLRGNVDGAKTYLANQAGITTAQANQRIDAILQDLQNAIQQAGIGAAQVIKSVGWTLFFSLLLGGGSAMLGGGMGASVNLRHPLSRSDEKAVKSTRAA